VIDVRWNEAVSSIAAALPRLTVALLIVSIAAGLRIPRKYFELVSHFRVQYLVASTAFLLISFAEANWWCAAGALLAAVINASRIVPYYAAKLPVGDPTISEQRLRLVLVNVYQFNRSHGRFMSFLNRHQPDVVVVQELTEDWARALEGITQHYPFFEVLPRPEGSGIALYSRFRFERWAPPLLEEHERPSILVQLDVGNPKVTLLAIHPRAPIRRGHFELRNKLLASAGVCLNSLLGPKICVGDLNTSVFSAYYQDFLRQTELKDVRKGFGLLPSWPTYMVFAWLMIPIDHCLVSRDIGVRNVQTGERIGSDHFPLIVELDVPTTSPARPVSN